MIINLGFAEIIINISVSTRKSRVRRDIKQQGKIGAIREYRKRYDCTLREAKLYIDQTESEDNQCQNKKKQ